MSFNLMINKKEIISILTATLVLGVTISLVESWNIFLITSAFIFVAIFVNLLGKKVSSYYLDTETEVSLWEFKRYGYKKHYHFSKPLLAGIFVPLLVKFFSVGLLNWMACLTFEVKGKIYRAARRHGIYSFSEVTEREIGLIAIFGILFNLLFALIGYLLGVPLLAKLNLVYAFYNMIPISNLDGSKIFFGMKNVWVFLATLVSLLTLASIFIA